MNQRDQSPLMKKVNLTVIMTIILIAYVFSGVYSAYANKSCASDSLSAMGLVAGDKVIFLSNGGSGNPDKGIAYQAYHQLCMNKKFGLNS